MQAPRGMLKFVQQQSAKSDTEILEAMEEILARLVQKAHGEYEVQQDAPDVLPNLNVEVLE